MEAYKNLLEVIPAFNVKIAMKFLQFLFFGLHLFYGVVGTLFITMFFFVQWVSWTYSEFLGWDTINLSIIFIVIGAIAFIISLFGGIVAITECSRLAKVYAVVVLVTLVVELNAAVTLFIMYGNIRPKVEMNLRRNFKNETFQNWRSYQMGTWDTMQRNMFCCGINHANDWAPLHVPGAVVDDSEDDRYRWSYTTAASHDTYTVPFSCCTRYRASENQSHVLCDHLQSTGCLDALTDRVGYALKLAVVTTGVMLATQLVGCIIAYLLVKVFRRPKNYEEMEKQELQHLTRQNQNQPEEEEKDVSYISEC